MSVLYLHLVPPYLVETEGVYFFGKFFSLIFFLETMDPYSLLFTRLELYLSD